ncbi:unnamed protein product, partial [Allacma fusca]
MQRYWIVRGRAVVKTFVQKCVTCFRHRAATAAQKMGDLPPMRVNQSRAFLKTGVDFAGPIVLKRSFGPRNTQTFKSYVCVIVCFTTHAIHLEPVSDLTIDALIAALKRFVSRRGLCSEMSSDCGTNFVGANEELQKELEVLRTSGGLRK